MVSRGETCEHPPGTIVDTGDSALNMTVKVHVPMEVIFYCKKILVNK